MNRRDAGYNGAGHATMAARRAKSPRPAKPLPPFLKDDAPPVHKDDSDPSFVTASGRELYHWPGFRGRVPLALR